MKKYLLIKILSLAILFIVVPIFIGTVNAASLKFDKTTLSVTNGGTFQIAVTVDPGSDALSSVDAYVTFDAAYLKATTVTAGSLFPTVSNDISTSGKVYIAGLVNDPASSISTAGTLATITFQALKAGTATLSFDCNSSKIIKNDINASNVIVCSSNGTSTVTIGSGGGGTTNPTATPAANTGVAGELPKSGIFDNVVKFAVPGAILFLLGVIAKLSLI
ncbi:hypothetical protein HZA75_02310 [Candidatus Roizmanbacteria bacterium]|nr:hypothetical protein [Candidatus Roizmanbacteria bacterium]